MATLKGVRFLWSIVPLVFETERDIVYVRPHNTSVNRATLLVNTACHCMIHDSACHCMMYDSAFHCMMYIINLKTTACWTVLTLQADHGFDTKGAFMRQRLASRDTKLRSG